MKTHAIARCWLAIAVAIAAAGCASDGSECENTLTLVEADRGTDQHIQDGCTSLVVALPTAAGEWEDSPTVSNPDVLRFDYAITDADPIQFYFTPLTSGETEIIVRDIRANDLANSWSVLLAIDLD